MQCLGDRAPVPQELSPQPYGESRDVLAVVDIAWRQAKSQQFPLIVDDEMQCETIEPAHRRLASRRETLEDLVRGNAVIVTHREACRVDEGNTRATAFAGGQVAT